MPGTKDGTFVRDVTSIQMKVRHLKLGRFPLPTGFLHLAIIDRGRIL